MLNKKIVFIISIVSLLALILLIFFIIFVNSDKETYKVIDEEDIAYFDGEVEVYSDVFLSDIIRIKGYTFQEDFKVDTSKVGPKELSFEYKNTEETKKGKITINVIDTTPPYIGIGDHYSHIIDTDFTFYSDVICKDNYDRLTKCQIIGDYNIDEIGETNVKIVAKDSSNNTTEKEFVLRVIERKDINDTTPKYKSLDEIKVPANASLMIDVSKWQENIDWQQVKDAGIDYVMMRLGTQRAVDKESVLDAYFEQNIKGAQEVGIKVGVYYFSYANDIEDAKEQARWVVEQLKDYKLDLPVSFDWECWKYLNDFVINLHEFNGMGRAYLKIIEENGYKAINYGSKSYLERIWDIDEYDTWLAHYNSKTDYKKKYIMWQFTDKGKVPGIKGPVDLDFYYNK